MSISRRKFIQGAAAVPLVTSLPIVAGAKILDGPVPTNIDVLMMGDTAESSKFMTDAQIKNLIIESASEAKRYQDEGSDVHFLANNLMEWVTVNCNVENSVFAGIAMLSTYWLKVHPDGMASFIDYVAKVQDYVFDDIDDDGKARLQDLRDIAEQIALNNPNTLPPANRRNTTLS